jgi:POT family proton-dependent oligopeptide transporter
MADSPKLTLEQIQDFKGKYPKQLWYLFFIEMWERFCFYGNRGMLTVFMVDVLLLSDKSANLKYGAIQAFVYAFTFIGGLFADKILGFQKSLLWGGILMITGSVILGISAHDYFYYGICLLIIGTGFFKPNISTMVGELYKEGDARRDAGFGLFYAGINVGALFGGAICVYVGKMYSWDVAFLLSGGFMILGLATFLVTKSKLGPIGLPPTTSNPSTAKRNQWMVYAGSILILPCIYLMITNTRYTDIFMYVIGPATLIYLIYEMLKLGWEENKKMLAALVFISLSILFWAFFEQSGGSLSLFAKDNLHTDLFFFNMDPNVVNNSSNSLFVVLFSPLIGLLWIWMKKRKIEPNYFVKFGMAFLFLGGAFYVFYVNRFFADADGKTSLLVFTAAYFVITLAELLLSPIGLSLMTKLSPKKLWGVMMGLWFLASAYGQYVAGILGAGMASPDDNASASVKLDLYTEGYHQLAIYGIITGIVVIIAAPFLKKLMKNVE